MSSTQRIGIFGGSFNPIHLGHVGVAERAAADYGLSKVLVVPAHVSPFKTVGPAPLDDDFRWKLVQLACEGHPLLEPCDIELRRGGVSYTIDTVREIKALYPDAELFFIVGEDSVAGLPYWRSYDELAKMCRFVSFPRTRESSTEIRRRMENGESLEGLVDPRVAEALALRRAEATGGRGNRPPRT